VSGSLRPLRLFRCALVSQLVEHALFGEYIEEELLAQYGVEATVASTDEVQVVTSALAGRWESAPGHAATTKNRSGSARVLEGAWWDPELVNTYSVSEGVRSVGSRACIVDRRRPGDR